MDGAEKTSSWKFVKYHLNVSHFTYIIQLALSKIEHLHLPSPKSRETVFCQYDLKLYLGWWFLRTAPGWRSSEKLCDQMTHLCYRNCMTVLKACWQWLTKWHVDFSLYNVLHINFPCRSESHFSQERPAATVMLPSLRMSKMEVQKIICINSKCWPVPSKCGWTITQVKGGGGATMKL